MKIKQKQITITEEVRECLNTLFEKEKQYKLGQAKLSRLLAIHHGFSILFSVKRENDKLLLDKAYRAVDFTQSQKEEMQKETRQTVELLITDLSSRE